MFISRYVSEEYQVQTQILSNAPAKPTPTFFFVFFFLFCFENGDGSAPSLNINVTSASASSAMVLAIYLSRCCFAWDASEKKRFHDMQNIPVTSIIILHYQVLQKGADMGESRHTMQRDAVLPPPTTPLPSVLKCS